MWKRLLVPHDFSRCSAHALDVATALAGQSQAELTLLHVSPLPPNLPADTRVAEADGATLVSIGELLTSGAQRQLAAIAAPLKARGLRVQTLAQVTEPGSPADAILRIARELESDLIVLGTHGRTGLAHLLLGSVAEKVIRGARVPVLTVRSTDEGPHATLEESLAEDELEG